MMNDPIDRNALARHTAWAYARFLAFFLLVIFFSAGTPDYWQGWVFVAVFALGAIAVTCYLWQKDPALLARRMSVGPSAERDPGQKRVMRGVLLLMVLLVAIPALDVRYGWSASLAGAVPAWVVAAGNVLVALGLYVIWSVFKANTYTAGTIQVVPGQTVVATGPYAKVRHPMYSGSLLLVLGAPLALASYWGVLIFFLFTALLIWRLKLEEQFLHTHLPGYPDYQQQVPHRLLPGVW